jgi:ribosomal protein L11 methyltransferase
VGESTPGAEDVPPAEDSPPSQGVASNDTFVTAFVLTVPTADLEVAADRLWQLGVRAVEERLPADGAENRPANRPPNGPASDRNDARDTMVELWTSLGADPSAASIERLRPGPEWTWRTEKVDAVPANTWREFAEPIVVADRVVVVPAWQEPPAQFADLLPVLIEPGGAFGLGDHPTTALSLAALIAVLDAHGDRVASAPGRERAGVLDVGCGTGLLAIGAALLGAAPVRAVDVSAAAVEATIDNASRNGVEHIVMVDGTPCAEVAGAFDVVVANILAPVLISLAGELGRLTARHGHLVISGVLASRYAHVVEALAPMVVECVDEADGWAAVTLRHPNVSG